MKPITTYITEALRIKSGAKIAAGPNYKYHPKTKEELQELLKQLIEERGNKGDFNDIDTSKITDMSELFKDKKDFNGDISNWDVSKVENMEGMFFNCKSFNQPLNDWDVSKVNNMVGVFLGCKSFNQPLNNWDISNCEDIQFMFYWCTSFNQDVSNWKIAKGTRTDEMVFYKCPMEEKYKPKEFWLPKFK